MTQILRTGVSVVAKSAMPTPKAVAAKSTSSAFVTTSRKRAFSSSSSTITAEDKKRSVTAPVRSEPFDRDFAALGAPLTHSLRTLRLHRAIPPSPAVKMAPGLVIFDKDGTLIDFNLMWATWVEGFAWKLENVAREEAEAAKMPKSMNVREQLFHYMGYDYLKRRVVSKGALCCTPMGELRLFGERVLMEEHGFHSEEAKRIVSRIWEMPDPKALARPLGDLPKLFTTLRDHGMKIAVCTTDNHRATVETLEHLEIMHMVDVVVGGDDPLPPKPSPDQIYHICSKVGVLPQNTIMVGDTNTDAKMGAAAGVGLSVGILDGASSLTDLAEHSDVLIPTLDRLAKIVFQFGRKASEEFEENPKAWNEKRDAVLESGLGAYGEYLENHRVA